MVVRLKIGDGGLDGSAAALDQWSHGALAAHTDDLEALMELAALEPDPSRFPQWLEDQLSGDAGGPVPSSSVGGVTLASIHAVKGREWPHVVVHHATDGLMPHRLAVDLEEERRVFHVGITRGRDSVCIVAGSPASPYLAEMAAPGQPPVLREPAAGSTRRASVAPVARPSGGAAELVAATAGLVFAWRGHDHAVTSTSEHGVAATVAGGPATTSVPYGSVVTAGGRSVLLGHPEAESAWTRLRAWRGERAKSLGKPAFVIFDDKTLRAVAAVLPPTERELLSIGGIGPVKLDAYGAELLAIVEDVRGGAGGAGGGLGGSGGLRGGAGGGGGVGGLDP